MPIIIIINFLYTCLFLGFFKVYLSSWLVFIKFPNEKQPLIQAASSQIYDRDIIFQFHKHAERPLSHRNDVLHWAIFSYDRFFLDLPPDFSPSSVWRKKFSARVVPSRSAVSGRKQLTGLPVLGEKPGSGCLTLATEDADSQRCWYFADDDDSKNTKTRGSAHGYVRG